MWRADPIKSVLSSLWELCNSILLPEQMRKHSMLSTQGTALCHKWVFLQEGPSNSLCIWEVLRKLMNSHLCQPLSDVCSLIPRAAPCALCYLQWASSSSGCAFRSHPAPGKLHAALLFSMWAGTGVFLVLQVHEHLQAQRDPGDRQGARGSLVSWFVFMQQHSCAGALVFRE